MTLSADQWKALAEFAGKDIRNWQYNGSCFWTYTGGRGDDEIDAWMPHESWNDFGPLWVLLRRWLVQYPKNKRFPTMEVYLAYQAYEDIFVVGSDNTESELMQAGCLLGAAIGATMNNPARPEIERK